MFYESIEIASSQRGLHYERGIFKGLLGPGRHRLWGSRGRHRVEISNIYEPQLISADLLTILRDEAVRSQLQVVELADHERALVWVDGRLHRILGAGCAAFWTIARDLKIEVIDARQLRVEHKEIDSILEHGDASKVIQDVMVARGQRALLFINESFDGLLDSGRYAFWRGRQKIRVELVEMREQQIDVAGQDILTRDNVSLRVNLVGTWRIEDPLKVAQEVQNAMQAVYRELQLALRAHISAHSLEELLAEKDSISQAIHQQVAPRLTAFGARLEQVGLKDVILPGEMKQILNRVIEAENMARANLITRREETAATRSLLNTARLMENNPTLLRLKELETAERIAEKIDSIHISNGLDELINRLVPPRA